VYIFSTISRFSNASFSLSFFTVYSVDARTAFLCFVYGLMAAKLEIPDCSWTVLCLPRDCLPLRIFLNFP